MIIVVKTVIITILRWISSEVLAPCSILLGIWQIHGNFIKTHGWSTGAKFSGQQSWWLERAMPGAVNTKFGVLGLLPLHNLPWNSDPLAWNTWHHLESGPWCVNRQSILQWALIPCYAFLHWLCSQCVEASSQPGCRHSLGPGGHPGRTKFPSAMTHVGMNQNLWNNTYFEIFSRMNIINIHELSRIPAILLWKSWGFQWVLTPWLPWFPRVSKVWAFGDDLNDVRMLSEVGEVPQRCAAGCLSIFIEKLLTFFQWQSSLAKRLPCVRLDFHDFWWMLSRFINRCSGWGVRMANHLPALNGIGGQTQFVRQ